MFASSLRCCSWPFCRVFSADVASAVDVWRDTGRRDGHAAGTLPRQPAAVDTDDAVRDAAAAVWQPAPNGRHLQVSASIASRTASTGVLADILH